MIVGYHSHHIPPSNHQVSTISHHHFIYFSPYPTIILYRSYHIVSSNHQVSTISFHHSGVLIAILFLMNPRQEHSTRVFDEFIQILSYPTIILYTSHHIVSSFYIDPVISYHHFWNLFCILRGGDGRQERYIEDSIKIIRFLSYPTIILYRSYHIPPSFVDIICVKGVKMV